MSLNEEVKMQTQTQTRKSNPIDTHKISSGLHGGVMSFKSLVQGRHCIREFSPKQVDDSTLNEIIETLNYAPSAGKKFISLRT